TPTLPPPPPTPKPINTPTPGPTPTPIPPFPYVLDGRVTHDNKCPGEYIIGVVKDAEGHPLPGVTVRMEDEYGNGDTRVTKSNGEEAGRYEFVITGGARRIYVWVVDEGGNPLSPRVEIAHRLPNSGYENMRCHYVNWRKVH
ncbi:MAG: carboxypeptidase regulatory-like domain-containing protein, partial [Chloroflexi bacterium]|nr:carboxypeptidase regulatory-like domain-containing protein [Chloroflexota bacterium]